MKPAAGQLWKAPAPRVHGGFRFVRIEQVRHATGSPYVLAVEVTREGATARPSKSHPFRGETFTIQLNARTETLPAPYAPV